MVDPIAEAKSKITYWAAKTSGVARRWYAYWSEKLLALIKRGGPLYGIPAGGSPPVTDQLATPAPTGIAGAAGSGSVTFTCDPVGDMHDGVTAASGVATYILNVNGVDQTGVSAPAANVTVQPTVSRVGAFSPDPTLVQAGRQFTFTSKGKGLDDAAGVDQLGIAWYERTGDFDLIVNMSSLSGSGASDFARMGIMWREATSGTITSATNCRMGAIFRFLNNGDQSIQTVDRITGATQRVVRNTAPGTFSARFMKISKRRNTTDVFTYSFSIDGGGWTVAYTSPALAGLSNTLVLGLFGCDTQTTGGASSVVTGVYDGLVYLPGTQAQISKSYTTSTTVTGKWKAVDVAGNVSAYSPTAGASGATSGAAVTYNPRSHWIKSVPSGVTSVTGKPDPWFYSLRHVEVMNKLKSYFASIGSIGVTGVYFFLSWRDIETSSGVYDFTVLDTAAQAAKDLGFRYGFCIVTASKFIDNDIFPDYMFADAATKAQYFAVRVPSDQFDGNYRWYASSGPARARIAALINAVGAHVKTDAKCEFCNILGTETAFTAYPMGSASPDSEYTGANVLSGFNAACTTWHAAAPNKMGAQYFNSFNPDTLETAQAMYAICETNFIAYMNPNSVHNDGRDISLFALIGMDMQGRVPSTGSSYIDYSLRLPVFALGDDDNDYYGTGTHGPALGVPYQSLAVYDGDREGPRTATNLFSGGGWVQPNPLTIPSVLPSHRTWLLNDGRAGDSTNQWSTAERTFIQGKVAGTATRPVPTCFAAVGVVTGG